MDGGTDYDYVIDGVTQRDQWRFHNFGGLDVYY
jgi:hypothetical protein